MNPSFLAVPAAFRFSFFLFLTVVMLSGPGCAGGPDAADGSAAVLSGAASAAPATPAGVVPPFEKITIAPQVFVATADQAATFTTPTGTTIEVPDHAFVTTDGQPVDGPVNLAFREFHSAADLLACGIPMRVKANDVGGAWLQTAGMFEIDGTDAAGRPVRVAEGKALKVGLASQVDGAYDFWRYDAAQQTWVNQVPGTTPEQSGGEQAAPATQREIQQLRAATARRPVEPVTEKTPGYQMRLATKDLDLRACPELREKGQTLIFLYAGGNRDAIRKKVEARGWDDYTLLPARNGGGYTLSMTTAQDELELPVVPVLSGRALADAQAAYSAELKAYEENLARLGDLQQVSNQQTEFRRSIALQGFGIYNYDVIYHRSDAIQLAADFDFGPGLEGPLADRITVYLITGGGRTVIGFPADDWKRFAFRPKEDNQLVAVLPGDRVAIFTAADFRAQAGQLEVSRGKPYVFRMQVREQPVKSLADLSGVLDGPRREL